MKQFRDFVVSALVTGLVVVVPIYLALLLLIRALQSLEGLVRPIAVLLPDWMPGESVLGLIIVLVVCFVIGALMRTPRGRSARGRLERSMFGKMPGYPMFKGLTQQLVGEGQENTWEPALAEIEEALVPAFIIEEVDDGHYTVFVPSAPTPFAGSVYILGRERVHRVNATLLQTFETLSRWGAGSKKLVAGMKPQGTAESRLM